MCKTFSSSDKRFTPSIYQHVNNFSIKHVFAQNVIKFTLCIIRITILTLFAIEAHGRNTHIHLYNVNEVNPCHGEHNVPMNV